MNHVSIFPTSMPQQVSHVTSRVATSHHACSFWPWRQSPCALEKSAPSNQASDWDEGGSSFGNVGHLLKVVGFGMTHMTVSRIIMGPSSAMAFFPCQTGNHFQGVDFDVPCLETYHVVV